MKEIITKLNQNLILFSEEDNTSLGLTNGKMGICIYFFQLSRIESSEYYKKIAKNILKDVCSRLGQHTPIGIEEGISGIALGIRYLIRENYISGNANKILQEIDDTIFNQLSFSSNHYNPNNFELILILFYFCYKLEDQKEGSEEEYFLQELIIKIINYCYHNLFEIDFEEPISYSIKYKLPIFLFIINKIHSYNFFNYKIKKIIEEITPIVVSKFPILDSNKLYLLWGMLPIVESMKISTWIDHASRLQQEININKILNIELKNKNIFINDGITSIYLLILNINKAYPDYSIQFNLNSIYDKIISSDTWGLLIQEPYFFKLHAGLLNGIGGLTLTILNIIDIRRLNEN